MSFPILMAEEHSSPSPQPEKLPESDGQKQNPTTAGKAANCPACDGSGLWRGIDGFVFKCTHCTFEMT